MSVREFLSLLHFYFNLETISEYLVLFLQLALFESVRLRFYFLRIVD